MKTVTILDYGIGNILSVSRAFEHCGARVITATDPKEVLNAEKLVLPGVGAFEDGMKGLQSAKLVEPLREYVKSGKPLLGICLGMQMLFDSSEEFGTHEGLGLIPGQVKAISETNTQGISHKIPHIGWNALFSSKQNVLCAGLGDNARVYFVHSFVAKPTNENNLLAYCDYNGLKLAAIVGSGNVYGCQFHPEKSGPVGLQIIKNFLELS